MSPLPCYNKCAWDRIRYCSSDVGLLRATIIKVPANPPHISTRHSFVCLSQGLYPITMARMRCWIHSAHLDRQNLYPLFWPLTSGVVFVGLVAQCMHSALNPGEKCLFLTEAKRMSFWPSGPLEGQSVMYARPWDKAFIDVGVFWVRIGITVS